MATLLAGRFVSAIESQTLWAQVRMNATNRLITEIRERHRQRAPTIKELAVDIIQLRFKLAALAVAHAGPTGGVAIAAVHHRQVMGLFISQQIAGET